VASYETVLFRVSQFIGTSHQVLVLSNGASNFLPQFVHRSNFIGKYGSAWHSKQMIDCNVSNASFGAAVCPVEFGPRFFDKRNPDGLRLVIRRLGENQSFAACWEVIVNNYRSPNSIDIKLKKVNSSWVYLLGDKDILNHVELSTLYHSRHNSKQVAVANAALSHSAVV